MKYSVEYKDGKFIETLEVDSHTVSKTWHREEGTISGLCSKDKDFSEQLSELLDEDDCDNVYNSFDNNTWVADIEDFVMISGLE